LIIRAKLTPDLPSDAIPVPTDTFAIGFRSWKHVFVERYFPDRRVHFLPLFPTKRQARLWQQTLLEAKSPELLVWGADCPEPYRQTALERNVPVIYMEDGFLRSRRRSASRTAPLSLTLDLQRPYFDCRGPSDLEDILNNTSFEADLLARARTAINLILKSGLTKYNGRADVSPIHEPSSGQRRILVVGQVEQDASIRYGLPQPMTNNDLVRLAVAENPDATIIYRPHPDVLTRVRLGGSNPDDVAHLCQVDTAPRALSRVLDSVDQVYTMTSLVGFEALLRGMHVTVAGSPFYAGWGLTDDRHDTGRRSRRLTIEELFAGAYILYPRYFDPDTGCQWTLEDAMAWLMDDIQDDRSDLVSVQQNQTPAWSPWGPYGILGWRHLLTPIVSSAVASIGNSMDAENYRANPIRFFRELASPAQRAIGRCLYPFDDR
jgi:capsule polysaccharide export protein KpsC/LpsZ